MTTRRPPIVDIGMLRERARRRLPKPVFDFVDGGAEDESTMRANSDAFDRVLLMPRIYEGGSEPDLGVTVLGQALAFPVLTAQRPGTLDEPLEARPQRLRQHLRRPPLLRLYDPQQQ